MKSADPQNACWSVDLSPLKLTLLAINGVCFGGLLVLLIIGSPSGAAVLLTLGTGLSFLSLATGATVASRRRNRMEEPLPPVAPLKM